MWFVSIRGWADDSRSERISLKMCYLNVRKAAEASLDIKDVIYQTSYFSKTIVMNIALPNYPLTGIGTIS